MFRIKHDRNLVQAGLTVQTKPAGAFSSLAVHNYRLFLFGRGLSQCGTWVQTIAASWLVLQLTHSGTKLGLVVAAQFVPVLVLGVWGGVIADRYDKRAVLFITQILSFLLVLALGLLVLSHHIQLWMIYLVTATLGLVNVIDNPARQSFIIEIVGPDRLKNAVSLYSIMSNVARVVGPLIAGTLITVSGVGVCFVVDALSFLAVVIALALMDVNELRPAPRTKKGAQHVRGVLSYIWRTPVLKITLFMMMLVGMFTDEFPVVFPLIATRSLHGDASDYSLMMVSVSIGSILGGLYVARHKETRLKQVILSALGFGVTMVLASAMPSLWAILLVLFFVGVSSVMFIALGNALLQLTSKPEMRGRVTALWYVLFVGTTAIGAPIVGYISDHSGARIGLAFCGICAVLAGIVGYFSLLRRHQPAHSLDVS